MCKISNQLFKRVCSLCIEVKIYFHIGSPNVRKKQRSLVSALFHSKGKLFVHYSIPYSTKCSWKTLIKFFCFFYIPMWYKLFVLKLLTLNFVSLSCQLVKFPTLNVVTLNRFMPTGRNIVDLLHVKCKDVNILSQVKSLMTDL